MSWAAAARRSSSDGHKQAAAADRSSSNPSIVVRVAANLIREVEKPVSFLSTPFTFMAVQVPMELHAMA